ncbi:HAMP domain-containing sensor histidine kinase [Chryseolinea sp. T2]|uniref:sensor histidine kinase n=1 Tax=Chryseolinea sp. T2 TaxID=3129255 RepID=UPI0030785FAF
MHNRHLRKIIALGTLVLISLGALQAYWFRKAFDVAEQQFDHSVQVALRRVADSVSSTAEVRKIASNFFLVETPKNLNGQDIDRLLKNELLIRRLNLDYELGVYNADDDTLVYGNYVRATQPRMSAGNGVTDESHPQNFAVYFPAKASIVLASLDIWIVSTIALMLMMGFFAYAIYSVLRERRFSTLKSDFVNNMTHEFKTPVTNISIAGEILKNKLPENHELSVYVNILLKENNKLRNKIDQVLLGSSAYHVRPESFVTLDVHRLLAECAASFELRMQERNGVISLELNATNHAVAGDPELLAQAIGNVVDNADKYSNRSPRITVRTRDTGNGVAIEIEDNGIGIPQDMRSKVFEKFFRIPSGDVHNVKGFGLGLSFVKDVILSHRGKINLRGELNQGTTVQIFLPVA